MGNSASGGILLICNSLIIGFVLYYAISLLFSYISLSSPMRPSSFILRLIVFTILLNFSYFICEQILSLNSNISLAIRNVGENIFHKNISFSTLIQNLNSVISIEGENFNIFSLDGLLKGFISIGLLNLVFTYSLRYIMVKIFVLLAPFAFLSLFLDKTVWFFQAWLKSFIALLFVQIIISLILLLTFSLDFTANDLFNKILCVGSIYALIKANSFIKELMGRHYNRCWFKFKKFREVIMKFIFPQNYNFKPKLFGFIDYSIAILNIFYWIFLYCLLNIIFTNLTLKISLFIIFALPVFILSVVGIHKENVISVVSYIIKFVANRKIYFYGK